ncbi:helix-turn-helix domain-containing protein [Streptomonospora salina]|uniref:DNA-binding transcriptional ArsR family regulator n=1 Tax=Streptomonospora salina TaxID=104205 RepID=A0A841EAB4_9ACTN|nr:helix-turn-helix domain-containing protein [Streptomonospora salina]MBB5999946.1 DNA-binding transcriptional ArsR family regulator [Streptomonospora salina]
MTRVRLTLTDTARIRIRPRLSPLIEAGHALRIVLSGPVRPGAAGWVRDARPRLAASPFVRAELREASELVPDVLPLVQADEGRVTGVHWACMPDRLRRAVRILDQVARAAVAPDQARVRQLQALAADRLAARIAEEGAAAAVEALGEACRWTDAGLEIADGRDRHLDPDGEGLELLPSVFLEAGPRVEQWSDPESGRRRTALLFPALAPGEALDLLLRRPGRSPEALGRLLGRTRSAVLGAVVVPASTGELAEALHVSPTSVSEHTAVLRETGMITTTREGNRVRHRATGLGLALLADCGAGPAGRPGGGPGLAATA